MTQLEVQPLFESIEDVIRGTLEKIGSHAEETEWITNGIMERLLNRITELPDTAPSTNDDLYEAMIQWVENLIAWSQRLFVASDKTGPLFGRLLQPYTPIRFDDSFIYAMAEVTAMAEREAFAAHDEVVTAH
jgi:hypothetical protein